MSAADKLLRKLTGKALNLDDVAREQGVDLLTQRIADHWGRTVPGRGLGAPMRRRLARQALEALGLDEAMKGKEKKD